MVFDCGKITGPNWSNKIQTCMEEIIKTNRKLHKGAIVQVLFCEGVCLRYVYWLDKHAKLALVSLLFKASFLSWNFIDKRYSERQ